jgi:ligand-binding sensor domain-containing protein/signal transduction histidine kinase
MSQNRRLRSARVALALGTAMGALAAAAGESIEDRQFVWETESPLFRVSMLSYGEDGRLGESTPQQWAGVKTISYGDPLTNVVFGSDLPSPGEWDNHATTNAAPSSTARNAPPRPFRPQYALNHWATQQGLPANKVNTVLQTWDGYLWVGTVAGLARFDGRRFTTFHENITPEMGRIGSNVRALFEDDERRLWIGTRRGMLCRAQGRFVSFPGQEETEGGEVWCFARRSTGGFWFGADDRLGYWDGSNVRWHTALDPAPGELIVSLAEGSDETLWVGRGHRLLPMSLSARTDIGPLVADPDWPDDPLGAHGLLLDRENRLWIGSSHGVRWLEAGATRPSPIGHERGQSRVSISSRFVEDQHGAVWSTTFFGGGLVRFGRDGGRPVATHLAQEMGVTLCITTDAEGALWVGTQHQGLFRLRPRPFATLSVAPNLGLNQLGAASTAPDGSLWFVGGTSVWRWSGNEIHSFDAALLARSLVPAVGLSAIGFLGAGRLGVGFPGGGVFELPASVDDPRWFEPITPRFGEAGRVRAIHTARDGRIWLGAATGLYRIVHDSRERLDAVIPDLDVQTLYEDSRTNLWAGTRGAGLVCLSAAGMMRLSRQDGLPHDHVNAFHEDTRGSLWIGTDGGLGVYQEGRGRGFAPESNVPQGLIYGLVEDDFHRLWLAHSDGISRVALSELEAWLRDPSVAPAVAHFDPSDGLVVPGITSRPGTVAVKGDDGRLWFATRGGLAVVDPADCPANIPAPQVWIERVAVDGQTLMRDGRSATPSGKPENGRSGPVRGDAGLLRLPPGSGAHLEVLYTTTSLRAPEKARLRFRLEGHDPGWRDSGADRRAVYANLGPGRYQFQVQARNHEGRWSERDATVAFAIAPYIWQTKLFYFGGGGILSGFLGGWLTWRRRRERGRLERERLRALDTERRRIARDIHDHLGARLAGMALVESQDEAGQQRTRETLRELNDLIWSIHPNNDTLPSLVDFIGNFASRNLSTAKVELDLDLPEQIPATPISGELRHEVAAMFKAALRNVIQHARAKRVFIRLQIDDTRLALAVRDDGCGFDPSPFRAAVAGPDACDSTSSSASGNGLRNLHSRSEDLGGSCRISSVPGRGTNVEIVVPLQE